MNADLVFLPMPRQMSAHSEGCFLPKTGQIVLDASAPQGLRSAAQRLQNSLLRLGLDWGLTASRNLSNGQPGITLRVAPERTPYPQGYRLFIGPAGVTVEGHDPAGVYYGACTLVQCIQQNGAQLPGLAIHDWPDLAVRGVMLDISRDRVYRMDYLYQLVDRLAGWKINQLQLYTEHTFAYPRHEMVWQHASPMTGAEILALDVYCRERFIELVPNQNSFGHMERWLKHAPYAALAETHDWFTTPWGMEMKGPYSLAPETPGSLALITSLYDDLLPHFTSRMVNVGCDETVDLGQGASKDLCAARGAGRVYLDYLLRIYADIKRRGYTMQFWGDILNNDHPELVAELPRDVIALNWGYDASHPFDVESARFAEAGVPFYVCPGTSSWNSLAGRTDNALADLTNAAENGIRYGAVGYLNTDWGDNGHWQVPPVSYLGFAAGAAYSWGLQANRDQDMAGVVSRFAFDDPSGAMGRVAYDLGNLYQTTGVPVGNGSALFWALQKPLAELKAYPALAERLMEVLSAMDAAIAPLESAQMNRPDAALIRREFANTARLMRHAVRRVDLAVHGDQNGARAALAADLTEAVAEFQALWLERSRPGGLADSMGRFAVAFEEYRDGS